MSKLFKQYNFEGLCRARKGASARRQRGMRIVSSGVERQQVKGELTWQVPSNAPCKGLKCCLTFGGVTL